MTSSTTEGLIPTEDRSTAGGPPELLEVGYVARAHGLRGEVVVNLTTNRAERSQVGAEFSTADGRRLVVEQVAPLKERIIVQLTGVHGREQADALRGTVLYAPPIEDPDAFWVHDLVGAAVIDLTGEPVGVVAEVLANPASDLLRLEAGALIPLRFVTERRSDENGGLALVVDLPAGLFEAQD